jgi:hypothetical protein
MKVYIAHSIRDHDAVDTLRQVLHNEGYEVFVAAQVGLGGNLVSEASAAIRSADALLAVLTTGNPNVFYELGLAAGAGVPILVAAPDGELVPSDLASVPYVQLTGDIFRDAHAIARRARDLRRLLSRAPDRFDSAEAALRAATSDPALLESLSPADFERLVIELFEERGYAVARPSSASDLGIDFTIKAERDAAPILVQVKKLSRQSRVSVETVRRLLTAAAVVSPAKCMLIATSGFTAAAAALTVGSPILLQTLEDLLAKKPDEGKAKA